MAKEIVILHFKKYLILILIVLVNLLFSNERDDYNSSLSFFKNEIYDISEESFKSFLDSYPDSLFKNNAIYYIGISLIKQNNYSDAVVFLEKLSSQKEFKYIGDVYTKLTISHFILKNYELAYKYSLLSGNSEKIDYIKIVSVIKGRKNESIEELVVSYLDNKDYKRYKKELLEYLINYYFEKDDYGAAVKYLEDIFVRFNLQGEQLKSVIYNYLISLDKLERYAEAISIFERHVNFYDEEVYLFVSDIYFKLGNLDKSIAIINSIFKRNQSLILAEKLVFLYDKNQDLKGVVDLLKVQNNPEIKELLGDIYIKLNQNENSYNLLSQLNREKVSDTTFFNLFNLSIVLNKKDTSKEYYNNLDRIKKINVKSRNFILYKLGELYYNDEDYIKAAELLAMWVDEFYGDENYYSALYMKGLSLKESSYYKKAIVDFTTIIKDKQKDNIYYESFVERGEIFFILQEYPRAIDDYNEYLSNRVTTKRNEAVTLQLGNAYFNIKKYDSAFKIYDRYIKDYKSSNKLYKKIAISLVRQKKYKDVTKYFSDKSQIGDFAKYSLLFSYYKLEDYDYIVKKESYFLDGSLNYFNEMLYITILSYAKQFDYNGIVQNYNNYYTRLNSSTNKDKKIEIKKEYFKSFLKLRKIDLANRLFSKKEKSNKDLLYFIGEQFYKHLFLTEASTVFVEYYKLINSNNVDVKKFVFMSNVFYKIQNYELCLTVLNDILEVAPNDIASTILKNKVLFSLGKESDYKSFVNNQNDKAMKDYLRVYLDYLISGNKGIFKSQLISRMNEEDIDNVVTQNYLLSLIELEYKNGRYKNVLKYVSKIPSRKLNEVIPQIRYFEALSLLQLGEDNKAIKVFLKMFYIYSYDIYIVKDSIKQVLSIYKKNGDDEKYDKIVKMFEEKYFILPDDVR